MEKKNDSLFSSKFAKILTKFYVPIKVNVPTSCK